MTSSDSKQRITGRTGAYPPDASGGFQTSLEPLCKSTGRISVSGPHPPDASGAAWSLLDIDQTLQPDAAQNTGVRPVLSRA